MTVQPPTEQNQHKGQLNVDDVFAAVGYRKRPHDKKWIPRRMREQWLVLIRGLLPPGIKDRMFAAPSPPLNTAPSLTSRERDILNISPIGFVSSRPSSPGSQLSRPATSLSEYFSQISSPSNHNNSSLQHSGHSGGGGGGVSKKQRIRFPQDLDMPHNPNPNRRGVSGGGQRSPSVSSIMWKKRPRSRADGRVSASSDATSMSQVDDIMHVTMNGEGLGEMGGESLSLSLSMSNSMSNSMPNMSDFYSLTSPIKTSTMSRGSLGSPVFGFEGQGVHQKLNKQLRNTSQKRADGRVSASSDATSMSQVDDIMHVTMNGEGLGEMGGESLSLSLSMSNSMSNSMPNMSDFYSLTSPIKTSTMSRGSLGSPVFGFEGQGVHQKLNKQLRNTSQKSERQSSVVKTFSQNQKVKKERERVNQRPKTVAGREYLETIKIKQREKSYDISCGNATIQKKWSKKIVVNAKDVLEDNRGWSNKTDAHEKR